MINVILPILNAHPYMSTEHIKSDKYLNKSKVIYRKYGKDEDTIVITDKDGKIYELPLSLYREISKE